MEGEPLTPEELDQLRQLTYQQNLAAWGARNEDRLAQLSQLAPLDGLFDYSAINSALDQVDLAGVDIETRNRISRIRTILTHDLAALLDRLERLKVAEPKPVAPTEEDPIP